MKIMSSGWIIGWDSTEPMVSMMPVIRGIAGERDMAYRATSIMEVMVASILHTMRYDLSITGHG